MLTSGDSVGSYDASCLPWWTSYLGRRVARSPRVGTLTVTPRPPCLLPCPLAALGFALSCRLTQAGRPRPRFVVLGPWICRRLPPHAPSQATQLPLSKRLVMPHPYRTFTDKSAPRPGAHDEGLPARQPLSRLRTWPGVSDTPCPTRSPDSVYTFSTPVLRAVYGEPSRRLVSLCSGSSCSLHGFSALSARRLRGVYTSLARCLCAFYSISTRHLLVFRLGLLLLLGHCGVGRRLGIHPLHPVALHLDHQQLFPRAPRASR